MDLDCGTADSHGIMAIRARQLNDSHAIPQVRKPGDATEIGNLQPL